MNKRFYYTSYVKHNSDTYEYTIHDSLTPGTVILLCPRREHVDKAIDALNACMEVD